MRQWQKTASGNRQIFILECVYKLMSKVKLAILLVILGFLGLALTAFLLRMEKTPQPSLKIIGVEPSLDPSYLYAPGLQIVITFNRPVSSKNFYYQLAPQVGIQVKSSSGERRIIFSPEGGWPEGDYSLRIFKTTTAVAGEKLDQDYIYQFRVGVSEGIGP